ncbi:MAG TPA: YihY/virulence factor BrkB family protein [Aggregatilineaceae bacterium]|nr:YihY/virulence factor BrkB family protein [Aggregatilineaceae bacterium]
MKILKETFSLLKETFSEWKEDKASLLAAALAYYTIFSLAPLVLVTVGLVSIIFDRNEIEQEIHSQVESLAGDDGSNTLQTMLDNLDDGEKGTIATVIGIVTLLLGATGVFGQLQNALNTIWEVTPKPGQGLIMTIRHRLLSFAMIPAIGFLLLVSLIVDAGLALVSGYFQDILPNNFSVTALQLVSIGVSFVVITFLFMLIFRILPDAHIAWSDVWVGSAVTALLFSIGRLGIGLYIGRSSAASAYGAAGSLIVILLWIYYSAQIVFFGAEFTQVYATRYGKRIRPTEYAMALPAHDRFERDISYAENRQALVTPSPSQPGRTAVNVAVAGLISFVLGTIAGFFGNHNREG